MGSFEIACVFFAASTTGCFVGVLYAFRRLRKELVEAINEALAIQSMIIDTMKYYNVKGQQNEKESK